MVRLRHHWQRSVATPAPVTFLEPDDSDSGQLWPERSCYGDSRAHTPGRRRTARRSAYVLIGDTITSESYLSGSQAQQLYLSFVVSIVLLKSKPNKQKGPEVSNWVPCRRWPALGCRVGVDCMARLLCPGDANYTLWNKTDATHAVLV